MLPELYGLVLTGGQSSRMGREKASIHYGELPQWRAVGNLLEPFCARTFWSCTEEQKRAWDLGPKAILDVVPDHGPASGLYSAFTVFPGVAWLVVACDYPFLEKEDIARLVGARTSNYTSVSFQSPDGGPEPLLAIWEQLAQKHFISEFAWGQDSPRRALVHHALTFLAPREPRILTNRNTSDSLAS